MGLRRVGVSGHGPTRVAPSALGSVERRSDPWDNDPNVTMAVSDNPDVVDAAPGASRVVASRRRRRGAAGGGGGCETPTGSGGRDRDELAARHAGPRRCCWPTGACPGGGTRSRSSALRCWLTRKVPGTVGSRRCSGFPSAPSADGCGELAGTPSGYACGPPSSPTTAIRCSPRSARPALPSVTQSKRSARPRGRSSCASAATGPRGGRSSR